jgi:hypothetical protein
VTSFEALLLWYPVFFLLLGVVLGLILKATKVNTFLIILLGYFLSNVAFYFLSEGGFAGIEREATGKGLSVFTNLSSSEVLSVLITPSIYSLFYIVLLLLSFLATVSIKSRRNKNISI